MTNYTVRLTVSAEDTPGTEHARLTAAHLDAAQFYTARLRAPTAEPQRRYLAERGLADAAYSDRWQVGYAPDDWTSLTDHLRNLGYSDQTLLDAGLALQGRHRKLIDRFRDRITLGIRNRDGDTVGFIARAAPAAAPTVPKYLNSPNTVVYAKSETLFGLAEQADALASGATPVIVEGPLDVLAVDAANHGRYAAVAPCGTALSSQHVADLRSRTDSQRVVVAFDPDTAGLNASINAYPTLANSFRTLECPTDLSADCADLLAHSGPNEVNAALVNVRPLSEAVIDAKLQPWQHELDNAEAKIAALRSAAKTITDLHIATPARHVAHLAEQLDLPHETVTREVTEAATRESRTRHAHQDSQPSTPPTPKSITTLHQAV